MGTLTPEGMASETMIAALQRPEAYPHPIGAIQLLQTHSSWVILTGPYAYKIKKPVNFGFLDFSTLALRQHDSEEELRLNRRLAPDLYLDLQPVHGPAEQASFRGDGPVIDVAVRMRQFDQGQLLTAVVEREGLQPEAIDALADELAAFQRQAAVAPAGGPFGTPAAVRAPVDDNLTALGDEQAIAAAVAELRRWVDATFQQLESTFRQRLEQGRIREGHGDLHLGNMLLEEGRIRVFDCLEFNPALRWIDGISELAFLVMDLAGRGCGPSAIRLLNRWLETSGDGEGLRTWRWYSVYRALVRAKVAHLRARQRGQDSIVQAAVQERDRYLDLAGQWAGRRSPGLVLMHGVSGSGKSWLSAQLAEALGAIRLRSDVERKRLFGLWGDPTPIQLCGDPYRREVSELLFEQRLPELASAAVAGGFPVLIDATFLRLADRRPFQALARQLGLPLLIVACDTPPELARQRIRQRQQQGGDPSDAGLEVLERQLAVIEPLTPAERAGSLEVTPATSVAALTTRLRWRLGLKSASILPSLAPPRPPAPSP